MPSKNSEEDVALADVEAASDLMRVFEDQRIALDQRVWRAMKEAFARHRLSHRDIPPGHVIVPVSALERSAKFATDGYRCRTCDAVFLVEEGHPEPECSYPNWDALSDEQKADAIRNVLNAIPKQGEV